MLSDFKELTGRTKVLGIIGDPIAHSLSPLMQNAALQAMGLDYVYVPFAVKPADLPAAVAGLRALDVQGFNVTIPHKTAVMGLMDDLSSEAELIGAVNAVTRMGGRLVGHNTDCSGFLDSLREDLRFEPAGARVLLLGAGGAARAAMVALLQAGVSSVTVANRTLKAAEDIVGLLHRTGSAATGEFASLSVLSERTTMASIDLLVNTTSIGMAGSSFAGLDASLLRPGVKVYDMVYVPAETPLLHSVRAAGIEGVNGVGMLAAQGEAAFRLWTGCKPPAGLMKARVLAALAAAA